MIGSEIKKVLLRYKGIMLFLIGIVYTVIAFIYTNRLSIDSFNPAVSKIITDNSGMLTEDKYILIKESFSEYNSESEFFEMMHKFYSGEISAVEYYEYAEKSNHNGIYRSAYAKLYEQAQYALDNTNERYLIDKTGWNVLFFNSLAYAVPIYILFLIIILFVIDCKKPVEELFATTANGRRRLIASKLTTYAILSFVAVVIYQLVLLAIVYYFFGLPNWNYPVQSIMQFQNYPWKLNLGCAYILSCIIMYIGALLAGGLVCLITTIFNNKYLGIVIGVLLCFENYLLPEGMSSWQYMYPINCYSNWIMVSEGRFIPVVIIGVIIIVLSVVFTLFIQKENKRSIRL